MRVIADTGVLVALLDKRDQYHQWATKIAKRYKAPFYTCEAVIAEAAYLLRAKAGVQGVAPLLNFLEANLVKIDFNVENHPARIIKLLQRYESVPMDYADACLVVMAEHDRYKKHVILTTDNHDFGIYRRNGKEILQLDTPLR